MKATYKNSNIEIEGIIIKFNIANNYEQFDSVIDELISSISVMIVHKFNITDCKEYLHTYVLKSLKFINPTLRIMEFEASILNNLNLDIVLDEIIKENYI